MWKIFWPKISINDSQPKVSRPVVKNIFIVSVAKWLSTKPQWKCWGFKCVFSRTCRSSSMKYSKLVLQFYEFGDKFTCIFILCVSIEASSKIGLSWYGLWLNISYSNASKVEFSRALSHMCCYSWLKLVNKLYRLSSCCSFFCSIHAY